MDLSQNHRQSLLSELEKAQADEATAQSLLNKEEHQTSRDIINSLSTF